MNYWKNKTELQQRAIQHNREMNKLYASEIRTCIERTQQHNDLSIHLDPPPKSGTGCVTAQIIIKDCTSVDAIFDPDNIGTVAVLNFASYKDPGGMYMAGSSAQEESLCHASFLYEVLCAYNDDWYKYNRVNLNKALYRNRALYSPNVLFERQSSTVQPSRMIAGVITCAAPNWSAASKYCNVPQSVNDATMLSRIRFVLNIAAYHRVDTLILGAYGCGVFGQNPEMVANAFRTAIATDHPQTFKRIVFAIPNVISPNFQAFKKVFCS